MKVLPSQAAADSLGLSGVGGPLLTLKDWAALAAAPRTRPGTQVTVRAKPVADGDITWFTWEGYVDPKVVKAFEKEYGVKLGFPA